MKRSVIGSLLVASLIGVLTVPVLAQSPPMTEAHIERIRANCVEAQSTLTQLHASDALLRVNRGQLYESISTKLMIPFNTRATSNKLDATALIANTTTLEQQLSEFRANYKQYEEAMTKTLRMNCTNQPVAFYDSVADTRAKRQQVYLSNQALQKTIEQYKLAFDVFKQKFLQENGQ